MSDFAYKYKKDTKFEPFNADIIEASSLNSAIIAINDFYCPGVIHGEVCGARLSPCRQDNEYHHFSVKGHAKHKKDCIHDKSNKSAKNESSLLARIKKFVDERGADWTPEKMASLLLKIKETPPMKMPSTPSASNKISGTTSETKKSPTSVSMSPRAPRTAEELYFTLKNLPTCIVFGDSLKTVGDIVVDGRTISDCRKNGIDGEYRHVVAKGFSKLLFDDSALTIRLRDGYPNVEGENPLFYDLSCGSNIFFEQLQTYFESKGPNARFAIFGLWTKDTRPEYVKDGALPHYKCAKTNGYVCKVAKLSAIYSWDENPPQATDNATVNPV